MTKRKDYDYFYKIKRLPKVKFDPIMERYAIISKSIVNSKNDSNTK